MNRYLLSFFGVTSTISCFAQFGGSVTTPSLPPPKEIGILDVIKGIDISNLSIFTYLGVAVILIFLCRSIFKDTDEYSVALGTLAIISGVEYNHTKSILVEQEKNIRIELSDARAQSESEFRKRLDKAEKCHFEIAHKTAVDFINKKQLKLIRQSNNTQEYADDCSIRYGFYVKKMKFNTITGQWETSDKVFLLSMKLTKYDIDLFGIDVADLIDEAKMTKLDLLTF